MRVRVRACVRAYGRACGRACGRAGVRVWGRACTTKGAVKSSTVVFAATAFTLYSENTAAATSVIVTVIVSAFPLSSDTRIDLIKVVVALGAVYSVVAFVVVRSTLAFL